MCHKVQIPARLIVNCYSIQTSCCARPSLGWCTHRLYATAGLLFSWVSAWVLGPPIRGLNLPIKKYEKNTIMLA